MSLDLLEINEDDAAADLLLADDADHSQGGESGSAVVQQLDVSARKLVLMWPVVCEALEKSLLLAEQVSDDAQQFSPAASLSTLTADPAHPHLHPANSKQLFQQQHMLAREACVRVLGEVCGKHSVAIESAYIQGRVRLEQVPPHLLHVTPPQLKKKDVEPSKEKENAPPRNHGEDKDPHQDDVYVPPTIAFLTPDDIDLIVERFEVGGVVHPPHLLSYFGRLSARYRSAKKPAALGAEVLGVSPFRYSVRDWGELKRGVSRGTSVGGAE
eukprot:gene53504-65361_t